jgi:uncharacterized protein GlcG (DUF336 family)
MSITVPTDSINNESAVAALALFRTECATRGLPLSFAIADAGGNIVLSYRTDGAQLGSYQLAQDKAYTAVAFQNPTSAWAESSTPGNPDWGIALTLGGRATVVAGGVPLFVSSKLVGAIGVSGTKGTIDEEIATSIASQIGCEVRP